MATHPSLFMRIAIGKSVGFVVGLLAFAALSLLAPASEVLLRWGVLLWYTTLGAIIGVYGVFSHHPVLRLPLPWWVRAPAIGAWMNLVLVMIAFDSFRVMMAEFPTLLDAGLGSPFWLVAEGGLVGALIGWLATKWAGEGPATVDELKDNTVRLHQTTRHA